MIEFTPAFTFPDVCLLSDRLSHFISLFKNRTLFDLAGLIHAGSIDDTFFFGAFHAIGITSEAIVLC